MTPERWERVGQVFHEAVAKPAEEARAWVGAVCADDPEVAAEVLSLLGSDAAAGKGFLTAQLEPEMKTLLGAGGPPVRVGPYRLVRELGRGGMGTVYLAERDDEQYQTQVAIKLVRRGMDTDLILHRFYRERQTLARLQHPHIARLLDGGTTSEGMPYIVMEYVNGARITDYCRERRLGIPQRLALFLDVCDAVEYAHRQFVVHRDLKPGNILVDEAGAVKLLDFGICKLLRAGGEETRDTSAGLMTPEYACPEQIRGEAITIASDVYSLAAVLYELLTGAKPHGIEEYTPREIDRAICEEEIVRPSLRAEDKGAARALEGDLDTILLFAMQKDPNRRYGTMGEFAEDIRRHLLHLPVRARPDTVTYRVGKFVRRRAGLVAAVTAVLVSMGAGVFFSLRSARIANENLALVRQLSNTFVFDVYDSVKDIPGATNARKLIVETGLRYLDNLSGNAAGDATLRRELAAAYRRIGDVQGNVLGSHLGNTKEATASYRKSLALLTPLTVGAQPDREALVEQLLLLQRLGSVYSYTKDLAQAEATYREAAAFAEEQYGRSPEDEAIGRQLANVLAELADVRRRMGDFPRALPESEKALALLRKFLAEHPEDEELRHSVAVGYASVGLCEVRMGRLRPALEKYRESAAMLEELVRRNPSKLQRQRDLMFTYSHTGDVLGHPNLTNLGDAAGAAEAYRRMADTAKKLHEADPADERAKSDYGIALMRAATVLPDTKAEEKIGMFRKSLQLAEEGVRGNPDNLAGRMQVVFVYTFLGEAYEGAGQREKAAETFRKGLAAAEPVLGAGNAALITAAVLMNRKLAVEAAGRGDRERALAHGRRAVAITEPASPVMKGRPATLQKGLAPRGSAALGLAYAELAKRSPDGAVYREEAQRWLRKSIEQFRLIEKFPSYSSTSRRERKAVETALESLQ
jgi:eukaryotic-like serine/threonine-protein kinase